MPSAITIDDNDVLLAIDLQADFMPGGALAVDEGDSIVPPVNALIAPLRPCRRHPGLASARPRLVRLDPRRRAVRRRSGSITATRRCGPTIASRGRRARRSIPALDDRQRLPHPAQGHARGRRFLFGLCRGGRQDDDRACGAPARARRQARLLLRARDRLLRRLFRARRARRRFRDLRHRGRLPGDRRQRFARRRLGQDERGRGLAHRVAGNPRLSRRH